ncbi:hypothetical protein ACIQVT_11785 [Streptomyces sp. NPDC100445]|uniref:hypothetical protein n=1 Tax=Streptomyces sp. NPDC100445 TaxID=3366102 RepID=UPI003826CCA4
MIRRLMSAAAMTAAVLATVVAASPAPAASPPSRPRACNSDGAAEQLHTTEPVHLRAGKGTRYRSLAVLARNIDFYAQCWGMTSGRVWWADGEVVSGRYSGFPDGRRGWVSGDYMATGYRHR